MGLEDIQSDLQALKKLYGLLHTGGSGLQDTSSEILDEKARLILKNLLDDAAEKIFEAHSEIIAAYLGAFYTSFSPRKQFNDILKRQPPPILKNTSESSSSVSRSTRRDRNLQQVISLKDEAEQSNLSISANKPGTRNKLCRVCHRRIVNTPKSAEETENSGESSHTPNRYVSLQHQLSDMSLSFNSSKGVVKGSNEFNNMEKRREKIEIQHILKGNEPLPCSSDNFSTDLHVEEKTKEIDHISKEVSSVIDQIESRISALEIAAKHLNPQRKKSEAQCRLSELTHTESNTLRKQTNLLGRHNLPSRVGRGRVGDLREASQLHTVPSWTSSQFAEKNKGIVSEYDNLSHSGNLNESMRRVPSRNDRMLGQMNRNNTNNKKLLFPAVVPSRINKENLDQNRMVDKKKLKVGTSQSRQMVSSVGSSDIIVSRRKTLAVRAGQSPTKPVTRKDKSLETQPLTKQKTLLIDNKPSKFTASPSLSQSRSNSSSSWSTQKADPSGSDSNSEEYSSPGQISKHRYILPKSSSSDSGTASRDRKVGSTSSSESEGYQRSDRTSYWSAGSASTSHTKNYRLTNPKKGRLRKLKDKLAIIFHHHHHHHHHHNNDHRITVPPGKSLWKNTGRIFSKKGTDKRSKEEPEGSMKKALVIHKKKQKGNFQKKSNFQSLAGRLLNNVRFAKKLRGGARNGLEEEELKLQKVLRGNGGVKMTNKSRVKLGVLGKSVKFKPLRKTG